MKNKYKIGQFITCDEKLKSEARGATAWETGRTYKIVNIDSDIVRINFKNDRGWGVFTKSIREATPEEILKCVDADSNDIFTANAKLNSIVNDYQIF